jgi:serine/threonine protein kinase
LAFTTQQNDQALALIDQMLSLCPEQRPSAEEALDHNFFWEAPLPAENIKDLVDKLKGVSNINIIIIVYLFVNKIQTNLFEYTSGCGAHANRKQRPVAPAAPGHVNGSGPNQTSRKPAISSNARTHVPPPHQQTRHAAVQIKQVQEFGVATSTKSSSNISEPISRDHKPHRQPVPVGLNKK